MSLQPGPEDRPDESALTPEDLPAGPPPVDGTPAPDATAQQPFAQGPVAQEPAGPPPPTPGGESWAAPPPPATQPVPPPPPAAYPPAGAYPPPGATPPPAGAYPPPGAAYPPAPGALPPPQGAPAPPPPAWGQAGAGWPAQQRPQTEGKAIVALILAIGSWVVCPLVLAIVALVLAGQSNRAIDASGGRLEGRGMNTATKVISWINIVLTVLAIIAGVIFLVAVANNPEFWDQFESTGTGDLQF
jgi:hypothetical protein